MIQYNMASYPDDTLLTVWGIAVAAGGGEVVVAGTAAVAQTVTLSSTPGTPMSLSVPGGTMVQPADGVTLTIDAPVQAGTWQIFDLSQNGTVMLGPAGAGVVRPEWFGAVGNGIADDLPALQAMSAALPAGALVLLSGTYRVVYNGSTAEPQSPPLVWSTSDTATYGIRITQPGVWVRGNGQSGIIMDGFTYCTACQYADSLGIDRFTAIAFLDTSGGGVDGVWIVGQGNGETLYLPGTTTYASRAKGVGITDSSDITVRDVWGAGIVGNLVNARGDNGPGSRSIHVATCVAIGCCENGFNFMGDTFACSFSQNVSIGNGFSGFETGTVGLQCTANLCCLNTMQGINHVGSSGLFTRNLLIGNRVAGFAFQGGATPSGQQSLIGFNLMYGNGNVGLSATSPSNGNLILFNLVADNGPVGSATGMQLNPGVESFVIFNNLIAETRQELAGAVGIEASGVTGLEVALNLFVMSHQYCVYADSGLSQKYQENVSTQPCSIQNVQDLVCGGNVIVQQRDSGA